MRIANASPPSFLARVFGFALENRKQRRKTAALQKKSKSPPSSQTAPARRGGRAGSGSRNSSGPVGGGETAPRSRYEHLRTPAPPFAAQPGDSFEEEKMTDADHMTPAGRSLLRAIHRSNARDAARTGRFAKADGSDDPNHERDGADDDAEETGPNGVKKRRRKKGDGSAPSDADPNPHAKHSSPNQRLARAWKDLIRRQQAASERFDRVINRR